MTQRRVTFVAGFRALARVGAVLCLLLAAVSLVVGVSEYPGYTRPALRWHATEELPLVIVGLINVAALDPRANRARWLGFLSVAVNLALLVYALQAVQAGAPPFSFSFMLAGAAALLLIGALGTVLAKRRPMTMEA